jgi:hypothetical protein
MSDFLWTFPRTGLAKALDGLTALRVELGLPPGALPGNALGDPRDGWHWLDRPDPARPWPRLSHGLATRERGDQLHRSRRQDRYAPREGHPTKFHRRTDKRPEFGPTQYGG